MVKAVYETQARGFITAMNGAVRLHDSATANTYRQLIEDEQANLHDAEVLERARSIARKLPPSSFPYKRPTFGYVVQWLSELGKATELQGLLDFADAKLRPTWENGGLFYQRNDERLDNAGEWAHMDPLSGNAAIGYSRLNVPDGQKKMWERPWTRDHLAQLPWIDGVDLSQGIDFLRGVWDPGEKVLIVTLKTWNGREVTVELVARNLNGGLWAAYVDKNLISSADVDNGGSLPLSVLVGEEEVDIVFKKLP